MIQTTVVDDLKISLNSGFRNSASRVDNFVIVGEEENGSIIYTWIGSTSGSSEIVTHVGVYNRQTKLKKEIYIFDRCTKVVNATISREESFLAFVTLEQSSPDVQGVYAAYIAEVRPANHLYSLSLESPNYILLRFINACHKSVNSDDDQMDRIHLLVIQHMKSVGIYHLSTACVEDKGLIMNAEPEKEQLVHKWIIWAEWNSAQLQLSVLQQKKKDNGHNVNILPLLTIYQFKENGTYRKLMHLFVDFSINCFKSGLKYLDISPCSYIPVDDLNFRVLQHRNGTICICYQQPSNFYRHRNSKTVHERRTVYSILLPHCGKLLQAKFSQPLPSDLLISFVWLGDRLLVHLPGIFSHLLNVNVHHEPVHHLLWQGDVDNQTGNAMNQPLVMFSSNESSETELYDPQLQCICRFTVSDETLVQMFRETEDVQIQLTVLRYAVFTSLALVKKLFKLIKNNRIFFRDMCLLFEEFLVSSTFELFRLQLDSCVLSYLPFTSVRPVSIDTIHLKSYSYQPVWNSVGTKICKCQMMSIPLRSEQNFQARFNLHKVKQQLLSSDLPAEGSTDEALIQMKKTEDLDPRTNEIQTDQNVRFVKMTACPVSDDDTSLSANDLMSKTEQLLGLAPSFLDDNVDVESANVNENTVVDQVRNLLEEHLRSHLSHLSSIEIRRLAHRYITCQVRSSKILLHILWCICTNNGRLVKNNERTEADNGSLFSPPSPWELDLLKCLECYYLVTNRLSFPQPSSFPLYFSYLVFRCRTHDQFLQHMEHEVVFMHLPFCKKIFKELDDSEENIRLKLQFLHHLKDADMLNCCKSWNHPYALQVLAQHFAANSVTSGDVDENVSLTHLDPALLPPVALFLQLLKDHGFEDDYSSNTDRSG